jgi:hypothetical protein
MTAETLLRHFRVYGCIVQWENVGRVVHPTRLTNRQRLILHQLSFPTPAQKRSGGFWTLSPLDRVLGTAPGWTIRRGAEYGRPLDIASGKLGKGG